MEPRYNEGPRKWQNLFAIPRFRYTVEPRYNEPLYNQVLGITNDFPYPSNSKMYEKEPRYNHETSVERANFTSPLALRYIEVLLYVHVSNIMHTSKLNK